MQVPPFWGYRMQCYGGTDSPILSIKELQKLLELTSRNSLRPMYLIYNSRNYQSLLAISLTVNPEISYLQQQKLLELTSPLSFARKCFTHLQQQKLLELTSLQVIVWQSKKSTIVEIIRAYQPHSYLSSTGSSIYNSRNYQSLLASDIA